MKGFVRGDKMLFARDIGHKNAAPRGNQEPFRAQRPLPNANPMRINKAGPTRKDRDMGRAQYLAINAFQTVNFLIFGGNELPPVKGWPLHVITIARQVMHILKAMGGIG